MDTRRSNKQNVSSQNCKFIIFQVLVSASLKISIFNYGKDLLIND